jgi:very-short-patch-repair endonuclease
MVSQLILQGLLMKDEKQKGTPAIIYAQARELRHDLTQAETILWDALRNRRLNGMKFRRQHPLGPFIADFYCAEFRLIIELDGRIHNNSTDEDLARTVQMSDYGYRVIRFRNEEVENALPRVLSDIIKACSPPL